MKLCWCWWSVLHEFNKLSLDIHNCIHIAPKYSESSSLCNTYSTVCSNWQCLCSCREICCKYFMYVPDASSQVGLRSWMSSSDWAAPCLICLALRVTCRWDCSLSNLYSHTVSHHVSSKTKYSFRVSTVLSGVAEHCKQAIEVGILRVKEWRSFRL